MKSKEYLQHLNEGMKQLIEIRNSLEYKAINIHLADGDEEPHPGDLQFETAHAVMDRNMLEETYDKNIKALCVLSDEIDFVISYFRKQIN